MSYILTNISETSYNFVGFTTYKENVLGNEFTKEEEKNVFCEKCGNKIPEDAKFCPKCGTSCSDDGNMPETNGGTKVGKKPKKRRKKSKAVIALCTAVAVVGVSIGGFALYKNYEKNAVIQKANDLDVAYGILQNFNDEVTSKYAKKYPDKEWEEQGLECKINYNTAKKYIEKVEKYIEEQEKKLKEETDKETIQGIKLNITGAEREWIATFFGHGYNWHEKLSDMKNVYSLYASYLYADTDFYTYTIYEKKKLPAQVKNLTDKDYSWTALTSYRVEDGKIYSKLFDGFKIEGELLDQDVLVKKKLKETQESVQKDKKNWNKILKEYEKQVSVDEALKEYEKYLNKWKTATKVEDEDGNPEFIMYRIKDYKDGVLLVEDCYRVVPQFSSFLDEKYKRK